MNSHVSIDDRFRTRATGLNANMEGCPVKSVSSVSLFQGTREIAIEHGESVYRLKITRQGKLILNK